MRLYFRSFLLCLLAGSIGCNSPFTPKERGYFRIEFPEHEYMRYEKEGFPYAFEYPIYGAIGRDSSFFDDDPDNPYWINLDVPRFNARIYLSYKTIGGNSVYKVRSGETYKDSIVRNTFEGLIDEAYRMTYKHTLKASGIRDSAFTTTAGVTGVYFRVEGNAATSRQFFVSDSVRHFLRGALYFETTPNDDSLSVVNDFLEADMLHLVETLRWRKD